jgi:hypothetical protein
MHRKPELTPMRAVMLGHAMITLPVLMMMLGTGFGVYVAAGRLSVGNDLAFLAASITALAAVVPAWAWWFYGVRKWRQWAERRSVDSERLEKLAVRTLLIWPNKWFEGQVPGE